MKLNEKINYIVSGLERSGTSMLMQILHAGGIPVAFDDSRPPDENNPRGYFELEGGKIINRLIEGTFPLERYRGRFIKITAYGINYLPPGNYTIIYSERNIDEILESMEKMAGIKDTEREETRRRFIKLNDTIKKHMQRREDIDVLFVNYNDILSDPEANIRRICDFLDIPYVERMKDAVDEKLYRERVKPAGFLENK
jgi:hypothetical protein